MTILDLQKELQVMYEKYGDIEVLIQNGDKNGYIECQKDIESVDYKDLVNCEIVVLS